MRMGFERADAKELAVLPPMTSAAQAGAQLIDLWPLTEATQLDNDAKYGENLQVRITQTLARVMTGQDVTIPDAEFVYEGADLIPGRPQEIVDALLEANDAYDALAGHGRTGDPQQLGQAADELSAWDQDSAQAAEQVVQEIESSLFADEPVLEASADQAVIAERLACVMVALGGLWQAVGANSNEAKKALPALLYANELAERLGIPRLYLSDQELTSLLETADHQGLEALAQALAPLVQAEWDKHRTDVLWDPEAAKQAAKDEDERKSREALQAKFAHVPEDPHKPPVEL